jgi:hypothetical protein
MSSTFFGAAFDAAEAGGVAGFWVGALAGKVEPVTPRGVLGRDPGPQGGRRVR